MALFLTKITVLTVQELTNWLNNSIDWLNIWLYCPGTNKLTEWFLADSLTEYSDPIVSQLTNGLNDLWLIELVINYLYCAGTEELLD